MAAAAVAPGALDFRTQGSFPIRLGSSITEPAGKAAQWNAIRYNHRPTPRRRGEKLRARIKEGAKAGETRLSLDQGDEEYRYTGRLEDDEEETYVLLSRGEGKDLEMVLERLQSRFGFNITSTPDEPSAKVLAERYPQLEDEKMNDSGASDDDDLFGTDGPDAPPDEDNPFDWRHFLKAELERAAEAAEPPKPSTPAVPAAAARSTPASRPAAKKAAESKASAAKKRKTPTTKDTPAKRTKAAADPPEPAAPAPLSTSTSSARGRNTAATTRDVPTVRVDRRASTRQSTLEDLGELILEGDTPVTEKPRSAMALALANQLGTGPISLQSAAGSPAGRVVEDEAMATSPQEYTFDFDDNGEDDDDAGPGELEIVGDEEEEEEDEAPLHGGHDEDEDVEDLELPSPAQAHRPKFAAAAPPVPAQTEGEDDDFEKNLMAAFDDDEPEAVAAGARAEQDESEEESEEE